MAEGQTIIQYGSVTLNRCTTRRIEQRPVWDTAGVGLKCWRFFVIVTGYLNGFPSGLSQYSSPAHPGAAGTHVATRWRLAPRQTFQMAVGCTTNAVGSGSTILYARTMDGVSQSSLSSGGLTGYDVNDGPRCLQFDVTQVAGNNVFRVEAAFEIHRVQCEDSDAANANTTGVLAHRWACSDSIDVNLRTVRTYHGILEIATSTWSPHWFRGLVVPPVQDGMRREHMDFIATEDGKKLQYTITDIDVAIAAPFPAKTWAVNHTVASLNGDAPKVTEQIAVTLTGDHDVDKTQLITLGLYIIQAKLTDKPPQPGNAPANPGGIFFNDMTITDVTGDLNVVTLSASCWRQARQVTLPAPAPGDPQKVIGLLSRFGAFQLLDNSDMPEFSKPYDPNKSFADPREGYQGPVSLAGIFRCYLQTPCDTHHGINDSTKLNQIPDNNTTPATAPVATITAVVAPSIPEQFPSYYSASHNYAMYTHYEMESKFVTRALRVACPIALSPYTGLGVDVRDGTSIAKIGPSQARRIVNIVAERVGQWPEFPDAETMDKGIATTPNSVLAPIRQVLLSAKTLAKTIVRSINGENLYCARFRAMLALNRAPTPTENLKVGVNKWQTDGDTATTATLTASLQEDASRDANAFLDVLANTQQPYQN